jgi:hypothetical protein
MKLIGILFLNLIMSFSSFASHSEHIASEIENNGLFKATYRVALYGKLEISMDAAIGAGVQDTYKSCKEFPCEVCAIQEFKTIESHQGNCTNGICSYAKVEVTMKGLNCGAI